MGKCKTFAQKDMLIKEYSKMIEPAIKKFGAAELLKFDESMMLKLKKALMAYHNSRKTVSGDAEGILAAQSRGETGTQLSLNSFHSVGYTNTALSHGVPRFRALIDASKSKHPIHILKTAYNNVEELNKAVGSRI